MKKVFFIIALAASSILFTSQTPPEKKYHFEFTDSQLAAVWYVLDNSSASHDQVKGVQALIQMQLKPQVDSTKKK